MNKMREYLKENIKCVIVFTIMLIVIIISSILLFKPASEPVYCTVSSYFNNDNNQSVTLKINASGKNAKIKTSAGKLINGNYYEEVVRENGVYKYEVISNNENSSCSTSVTTIKEENLNMIKTLKMAEEFIKVLLNDKNDLTKSYSWDNKSWSKNIEKSFKVVGDYNVYINYNNKSFKEVKIHIKTINEKYTFGSTTKLTVNQTGLSWSSSDSSIITVDMNGNLNFQNDGYAAIMATTENDVYIWGIEVLPKVTSIKLNKTNISLEKGKTEEIKLEKLEPENAICSKLEWESSNSNIVTVNQGKITAISDGEATIKVSCDEVIATVKVKVEPALTFVDSEMTQVKNMINNGGVSKVQVAVINKGKIVHSYAYNCKENDTFYVSSLSKSVLGITAAKMEEDGIVDLDTTMDTYWYKLKNANFNEYSSSWKSSLGSESTLREYAGKKLFQNPATLRNALTHSSTIENGNMLHMVPNDPTSEYFGGSLSKTYSRAAFMLAHTSNQLFEKGGVPGAKTSYNYLADELTREHALAGFTMQIAMKESINEYIQKNFFNSLGINNARFKSGNSIYFAAGYESSALDFAKIVSLLANDGKYNNKQILKDSTLNELEKVESNLANQSIAFTCVNNRFVRYGNFSRFSGAYNYDLSILSKYYSYASYDPNTGHGLVVTTYGNDGDKARKLIDNIESYVYLNS